MTVRLVMPWGDIVDLEFESAPEVIRLSIGDGLPEPLRTLEMKRDQELSVSAGMWVYL